MAEEANNSPVAIPDLNLEPVDDSTENRATFEHGEGSNLNKPENEEVSGKKVDNNDDGESLFSCPICLDLAKDPVVTPCGHLFFWPCLYRWMNGRRDDDMDCPVCKGAVDLGSVTPIYGRGTNPTREPVTGPVQDDIPLRPHARRVESWRGENVVDLIDDYVDPVYDDEDFNDEGLVGSDPEDDFITMDNEVAMALREAYDYYSSDGDEQRSENHAVDGGEGRSESDNVDVGNAVGSIIDISAIYSRFNNNN